MAVQTGDRHAEPPPTAADAAARPRRFGIAAAALLGIVAVGVTFAIAELIAAFAQWTGWLDIASSPIAALGSAFIDLTPEWLKEWAIRTFGQNDKTALRIGMLITVVITAALIGVVGRWRPRLGVGLAGLLLVVAGGAVVTRANSSVVDLVPLLIGAGVGLWVLVTGLRFGLGVRGSVGPANPMPVSKPVAPPETTMPVAPPAPEVPVTASASMVPVEPPARAGQGDTVGKVVLAGADHPMAAASARGYDRRAFFRVAGLGALVAVAAGALSRWIPSAAAVEASREAVQAQLPTVVNVQKTPTGTLDAVPGITPFVSSNSTFYRVDTAFTFPGLTAETWKLKIHGACDNPFEIDYADLVKREMIERMITLTCVSNEVGGDLAGNATWQGVRIADLLAEAKPRAEADCVLSTSAQDGFTVTTPLSALTDGRDALLAVKMNGEALPVEHGFPVRMVVPGLYGYVSATKWVVDMEISDFAQTTSFWSERGWAAQAPIKTASRIDTPRSFAQLAAGKVAVAGVAWAQHRGIKAVQVQVDEGEWAEATLSSSVSEDTWRQWVWEWDATPGQHTLRVRAIDGTGELQTGTRQDVMPDGATGWHSRVVTVG